MTPAITADINVALVGYGFGGRTFHAPLIRNTPGLNLHSIVSSDPAKVHADLPGANVVGDLPTLLADPAVDLVVIVTPDALHAPHAHAALDAGKHVIIDKPLAATLAEARAIAAHAAQANRFLSIYQNRRWDSDFVTLRKLIEDGALGEIVQFESHYDRYRPVVVDRWKERAGAGVWQDLGPHLVDQALQLFGRPEAVFADLARQKEGALVADYFHVLLRYPRLRVVLHASQMAPASGLRYAVHGTRGSFIKHGLDAQEAALKEGSLPGTPGWGADPHPGTLTTIDTAGVTTEVAIVGIPGDYPAYYRAVRNAILGRAPNPVTPDQALDTMTILDLGHRSSAARAELPFDDPAG